MRWLRVLRPGLLDSVQDLGRPGFGASGVAPAGAADPLSLRIGNRLLGNDETHAAIEMTLTGPTLVFDSDAVVCLVGADAPAARIEHEGRSRPLDGWTPTPIDARSTLTIGPLECFARVFLCIDGGIATAPVLGSRSVHIPSGVGGGTLRAGDRLPLGEPLRGVTLAPLVSSAREQVRAMLGRGALRIVPGAQHDAFETVSLELLTRDMFRVGDRSDRTGLRLLGPVLGSPGGSMRSEGVVTGALQVPPDGGPIALLVDRPTTGGYPVIASIISADLPAMGQRRARDPVAFEWTDQAAALAAACDMETFIASIPRPKVSARASARADRVDRAVITMDLNCDAGEAADRAGIEAERRIFELVTSVNIACTGHAGDEESMRRTILRAIEAGCAVGAHPSYPDREGFGRRTIAMDLDELEASLREQIACLGRIAASCGVGLTHVKPHGALYHDCDRDPAIASRLARAARAWREDLLLIGGAGSPALGHWTARGMRCAGEAFADRVYERDGSLRPRLLEGAVIGDPAVAAAQALRIARERAVVSACRHLVELDAKTICIHSDTPGAGAIARAVLETLKGAGIRIERV